MCQSPHVNYAIFLLRSNQLKLLRQCILSIHMEFAGDTRRSGIGLTSADADRVIPLRNDRVAILRDHAKITRRQIEVNFLAGAGLR